MANRQRLEGLLGIYPDGQRVSVAVGRDGIEQVLDVTLTAPQRARLGLAFERARGSDLAPRVQTVEPGSAAEAAGFRPGDTILAWDGRRLEFSSRDERRAFDRGLRTSINAGDILVVTVARGGDQGDSSEVELRLVAR